MTNHRPLIVDDGLIARLGDGDTLMLPTVTPLRLLGVDRNRAVISVSLSNFIKGAGTILVQDDGAGGVIMTVPQSTLFKLLGDNDTVIAGSSADTAWDGVAPITTWTAIWKAVVARLEAVRLLVAGTLKVDGSAVTQPVSPKQFSPTSTVKLSPIITSVSATVPTGTTALRIYNSGPSPVFVRWGTGAQTATANDLPIASGACETFGKASANDTVAAISTGMATVYVS
ncbi:MAG: hypothetical protein WCK05_11780, partial [Planctomycetota bacterium]